jgi:CoA:oxalate CoA-transferase
MTDRILEIGNFAAGYCGRLFAHAGHDVVRVEPPAPAPGWVSSAASDRYLHAGKRRIATADAPLLADLAARADVVIVDADSADALAASGFDAWAAPVKVAITPFGRTGPRRNWHATPHVLLAMGGYTCLMGDADRAPLSLPGHFLEFQAGQYAYIAANACRLAGLLRTVDIAMLETLLSLSQFTMMQWHCKGEIRGRHGNELWSVCPSNLYRLADGAAYVNIIPSFWDAFAVFIDRPDLLVDPRFATNDLRMANREVLHEAIARQLAGMTRVALIERAELLRVPAGVFQTLDEVLADPHLAARGFWQAVSADDGPPVRSPAIPWRFDEQVHSALSLAAPAASANGSTLAHVTEPVDD